MRKWMKAYTVWPGLQAQEQVEESRDTHSAIWWESDVEVTYGCLGKWPVVSRFFHEGQSTTWILSVVSDLMNKNIPVAKGEKIYFFICKMFLYLVLVCGLVVFKLVIKDVRLFGYILQKTAIDKCYFFLSLDPLYVIIFKKSFNNYNSKWHLSKHIR